MVSARKRKEKKKDFTKQKIKVGKTAPKGANQTSTEFKAKKITISSTTKNFINHHQTKENSNNLEYLKKLSVVRKTTSNLNSRKEILAEFLELLKKDPFQETHQIPLDELLKVIKMLFLDQSKKIRTNAREILIELIKNHNNLIILNHDSIMLFIFSAMTHLKPTIRQDSIYTLRSILDGGERLKNLTIANYWIRVWKNILVLMNWKKENKSYVDSNDFKDFDGMRLEQLNFIYEFLSSGCVENVQSDSNDSNDDKIIQNHSLLSMYMIKPNMGMLYRNLKLFGNVSIVSDDINPNSEEFDDTMLCEDLNDRVKTFYEGFFEVVIGGLTDFTKVDDKKIVLVSNKIIKVMEEVKVKYSEISD